MQVSIRSSAELSAQLRALRKAKGWSQAELGKKLGVTQARIAYIEGDPSRKNVTCVIQMLQLLDARILICF